MAASIDLASPVTAQLLHGTSLAHACVSPQYLSTSTTTQADGEDLSSVDDTIPCEASLAERRPSVDLSCAWSRQAPFDAMDMDESCAFPQLLWAMEPFPITQAINIKQEFEAPSDYECSLAPSAESNELDVTPLDLESTFLNR